MKRLLVLAVSVVLAGCASAPSSSDFSPGDAESAIRRANSEFAANVRSGNAQKVVDSFYAPDAVVMSPNLPAVRGRDAIRQFWTGFLASGAVQVALTANNVTQSCGDLAVESGRYDLSVTPQGGQAVSDVGKYIVVWRKIDGRWWATADIFNSDLPLPGR